MTSVTTGSPGESRTVGAALAVVLRPGDVVLLCGDLGAGKTTFAQGVGEALGVGEQMTSPTFTLVQTYGTDPVVAHADAWRLTNLREVLDLGLDELLDEGAVALVEWGDTVSAAIGRPAFVVRLARPPGADEDLRSVTVDVTDDTLAARLAQLDAHLTQADRS